MIQFLNRSFRPNSRIKLFCILGDSYNELDFSFFLDVFSPKLLRISRDALTSIHICDEMICRFFPLGSFRAKHGMKKRALYSIYALVFFFQICPSVHVVGCDRNSEPRHQATDPWECPPPQTSPRPDLQNRRKEHKYRQQQGRCGTKSEEI